MADKKQLFRETELRLSRCQDRDVPSEFVVNALCLVFVISKFRFLTSTDSGDPVPNVGRCRKRCFALPVPDV